MRTFLKQLLPLFLLGFAICAFAFGIILIAYLFLFAALVGFILFIINWLHKKFFPTKTKRHKEPRGGRIIDTDDWRKL